MNRLRDILLVALLLLATLLVSTPTASARVRTTLPDTLSRSYRHTEAVKRLAIYRDTTEARRLWHEIIAEDSTYAPALYYLSNIENDSITEIRYAHRAFAKDSTNKWYTENYALKLIDAGLYTRAIPIYRRLMRLDPKNVQPYHALAVIYGGSGMPYSAISVLDSAELRIGYNHYLAEIKQQLLLETHQYDKAIELGIKRSEEFPYDIGARTMLAIAYDIAKRDSLAEATYEEVYRLDTTNVKSLITIVDYHRSRNNVDKMLRYEGYIVRCNGLSVSDKIKRVESYISNDKVYAKNYLRIGSIIQLLAIEHPNNREVVNLYAHHLIAGGEAQMALDYLRGHLRSDDTTAEDCIYLLGLEQYLEREDLLAEDLKWSLERFPDNLNLTVFLAYQQADTGDYKGAIKTYKQGIKSATEDKVRSELWGYIGDTYHQMGDSKAAFSAYRKALGFDADNILVLNNYAYFLSLEDRDLEEALRMSARAIALEPNNATYIDTYAWILHRLGRNEEAKQYMRQALSLSSQRDASLLAHYGDILWALGEEFMAETYWQKAVERGYDKDEMETHIQTIKHSER